MDNNFNNQNDNFTYGNQPYDYQPIPEPVIPDPVVIEQPAPEQVAPEQPVQGQVAPEQPVWNEVPQNNSYQNPSYYNYQQPVEEVNVGGGSKALAIVSLVCGILSIVMMCCGFLGTILSIVAIVTAIVYKSKSVYKKFDGMSLAGLICGIIGLLGGVGYFMLIFLSMLSY